MYENVLIHQQGNFVQGYKTLDPYKSCAALDGILCLSMNRFSRNHYLADLKPEFSCSGHEQIGKRHISTNSFAQGCKTLDPYQNCAALDGILCLAMI